MRGVLRRRVRGDLTRPPARGRCMPGSVPLPRGHSGAGDRGDPGVRLPRHPRRAARSHRHAAHGTAAAGEPAMSVAVIPPALPSWLTAEPPEFAPTSPPPPVRSTPAGLTSEIAAAPGYIALQHIDGFVAGRGVGHYLQGA